MWYKKVLPLIYLLSIPLIAFPQIAPERKVCSLMELSELTLEKNPSIQRQYLQVQQSKANLQIATSIFDYRLNASSGYDRNRLSLFQTDARNGLVDGHIRTNTYTLGGGLQRTFRSGMTANLGLDYSRTADNFPLNSASEEVGAFYSDNITSTALSVSQPLLRGSGRKFAAASEKVAGIEVESNVLNLIFASSGELLNTVLAYWQYLNAYKSVKIYQENEDRVRKVLQVTHDLVEAEKKPAGDLIQVKADLTDKERQTLLAKQQLYNARRSLGRFVGLSEVESERLGVPVNEFPSIEASRYSTDIKLEDFITIARTNRTDLKSMIKTSEALGINLNVAGNSLKPQLDLGGFISYGGYDAGNSLRRIVSPLSQSEGRNVQFGVSLNYLFPLNNNYAQANLVSNQIAISNQQVILDNQIRNIELNVSIAYNNLNNSVLTVEKASQTLAYYQEVFENEQVKFQNGLSTILNLIFFQERLTFAQLDYLSAQQQFAQSIINLRYETGTLLPGGSSLAFPENQSVFYQLPLSN